MKKFLLFALIFSLIFASVPVFAAEDVTVEIDSVPVECKDVNGNVVSPMLIDGTTYLPVRAIANALNLEVEWDDYTKTVFINGAVAAEPTDNINIYINGSLFTAKDVNGKVVHPILKDGTTYLPVRAISEAFNKRVKWTDETKTVSLSTPKLVTDFSEHETYVIVNKASEKVISVTDGGLTLEKWEGQEYQFFKFIPSDTEGYYYIQSVTNGKNFDVNGNSKNKGAKIITYNPGTADNQKFAVEKYGESYNDCIIYALSSNLPIEDSAGTVKQNILRESTVQRWEVCLVENIPPVNSETKTVYRTVTADSFTLSDNDNNLWEFIPNENGEYIITNKETGKSLDVANNSKTSGDPVITYATSGDANQRWTIEKQEDGTYLVKSVHSSLYLSVNSDGSLIHAELNDSYKQSWSLATVSE